MKTKTPKLKIDQPEVPKTPLRLLADALRPYKVTDMEVDFAGCGDSGDINDIRFYKLKSDKRAMSGISPSEINYQDIPSDLRFLSDSHTTLADGLEYHDMESDGVLESIEHIREMLALKATKAVGRA